VVAVTYQVVGILHPGLAEIKPSLTTWSRLEPQPATADLAPALGAPVADPLWFLHRQWAFGELDAEDAGSPIDVRLKGESARLARYHPGPLGPSPRDVAVDYAHLDLPLEVAVEREEVRAFHPRLAAVAGQHFLRLLESEGGGSLRRRFVDAYPLVVDLPQDPVADRAGAEWAAILTGRALDGDALAEAVRPHVGADGRVTGLPADPSVPQGQQARVGRALTSWIAWYDGFVSEPESGEASAWRAEREEYALALSAQTSQGLVVLRADEYTDGHLDWWSFLASIAPDLGDPADAVEPEEVVVPGMLPAAVRYPGMPADRYWQFEDGRVNLGALDAGPGDLGRLLLVEFGLVYGTDWWVVPLELPVGSLFKVADLTVRDTFGVETTVGPSRNPTGAAWEMFELGTTGRAAARLSDLFFLPPTLPRRLEGDPVEAVTLLRDEMANLAWAVERRVPGTSGEPFERQLEASRLPLHQALVGDVGDAQLLYRLMTPVPVNWIPFEPVATAPPTSPAFDIAFERRVLLRTLQDGTTEEVHPRGLVLRSDPSQPVESEPPLRVPEEEFPRDGAIVTRSFQYARWFGGRSLLWLGRAKRTGLGPGSSDLHYDTAQRV
jgi:hypothetical protein